MKRYEKGVGLLFLVLFLSSLTRVASASPVGTILMAYVKTGGTFTYCLAVTNSGPPLFTNPSTPPDHTIRLFNGAVADAGGVSLTEDQYFVEFGLDTLQDDLMITNIRNASGSAFTGSVRRGFRDADNDGTRNQAIVWHLGNNITRDQTIEPGEVAAPFCFTLNREVRSFEIFFGGTDDLNVYNLFPIAGVDDYGRYDAALQRYFSTYVTLPLFAMRVELRDLEEFIRKGIRP